MKMMKKMNKSRTVLDLTTNNHDDAVIMSMETYRSLFTTEFGEDQSETFNGEKARSKVSHSTHGGLNFPTNKTD